MKIGKLKLEVAVPDDLEQKVHALLSASVAEVRRLLDGHCIAGTVAKALQPFLTEECELADLARLIARHGVAEAKAEVARLYDTVLGADEQQEPTNGES